jgi:nucleoside-diphosphate-sugar epimerase
MGNKGSVVGFASNFLNVTMCPGGSVKTLITGASGFLGTQLIKELQHRNEHELFGISRHHRDSTQNLKWLQGDLNDKSFVKSLSTMGFEKVFHLSWEGLPDRGEHFSQVNLENSIRFLKAIASAGEVELNVIGSCLEYGTATGPVRDSEMPSGNDVFALAKIAIHEFTKSLGVPYRWYRPFYIFGIGQSPKSLIPSIIAALSVGKEIEVKAINNSHDFISVDDLARAIVLSSTNQSIYGEINIGTGELTCVGEILKEFHSYYGQNFSQLFSPNPGLYAKPEVLIDDLHWKPIYVGAQGIMEYFKSNSVNSNA